MAPQGLFLHDVFFLDISSMNSQVASKAFVWGLTLTHNSQFMAQDSISAEELSKIRVLAKRAKAISRSWDQQSEATRVWKAS